MPLPLEGIRVLDWTVFQQGPAATAMLADLGADVIKIESPVGDPGREVRRVSGIPCDLPGGRNCYFEAQNRSKRGIVLDLKKNRGKEVLFRLVSGADVFVHNFRKAAVHRLGLEYSDLSQHNQRLIYAAASGYGPEGGDATKPAYDILALARSGFMSAVGEDGMPPMMVQGAVADEMGAIMLAYGVVVALLVRERTGVGQEVSASQLGSMISLQRWNLSVVLFTGQERKRHTRSKAPNPIYNYYKCGDGNWLALAHPQSDRYWEDFCRALHIEHVRDDPRFRNMDKREENCEQLVAILDTVFLTKTRAEWTSILDQGGDFLLASVNTLADLVSDPQVLANEYIVDYDHPVLGRIRKVGSPIRFSKTPASTGFAAPGLGQHTEEILGDIGGYTEEEIRELKEEGVV